MTDKTLATFRVEAEQWQAFKAKAAEDGKNATALLLQWVSMYLDGKLDVSLDSTQQHLDNNLDNNLDTVLSGLDIRIDSAIAPLQQQIDELKAELGEFAA